MVERNAGLPLTKARDGLIKALRDAHRWLDELLVDPTQTIESLAVREGKSERSIRMTLSLAFISPVLARCRDRTCDPSGPIRNLAATFRPPSRAKARSVDLL